MTLTPLPELTLEERQELSNTILLHGSTTLELPLSNLHKSMRKKSPKAINSRIVTYKIFKGFIPSPFSRMILGDSQN